MRTAIGEAAVAGAAVGEAAVGEAAVAEPAWALAAWAEVLAEFSAVDAALSRFRDDSELTMLNRLAGSGKVVAVSRRTRVALAAIDRAGRITDHRFDASILSTLERIGEHGAALGATAETLAGAESPTPAALAGERLYGVHVPPVPVDMGGIGKGLALRWAADRAARTLPAGAGLLIEAGGDLVQAGTPPDGGWLVGIEDPVAGDEDAPSIVVVGVNTGAVATSSVRVRNWIAPDGLLVHHLVDPATRQPARGGLISVTVAARDPAWAEVWSKALFIGGRARIADEARARGLASWWVDERGRLGMTPEARIRTAWAAEDRLG